MSIREFFGKEVVIRRLSTVSGYRKEFGAIGTADCAIQAYRQEGTSIQDVVEGRTWIAWCDSGQDVKEGDRLTDDEDVIYIVRETNKRAYGINEHLEVLMEEYNE